MAHSGTIPESSLLYTIWGEMLNMYFLLLFICNYFSSIAWEGSPKANPRHAMTLVWETQRDKQRGMRRGDWQWQEEGEWGVIVSCLIHKWRNVSAVVWQTMLSVREHFRVRIFQLAVCWKRMGLWRSLAILSIDTNQSGQLHFTVIGSLMPKHEHAVYVECVYVHVCMCVLLYVCVCVHMCIYLYVCVCAFVHMCMCAACGIPTDYEHTWSPGERQ